MFGRCELRGTRGPPTHQTINPSARAPPATNTASPRAASEQFASTANRHPPRFSLSPSLLPPLFFFFFSFLNVPILFSSLFAPLLAPHLLPPALPSAVVVCVSASHPRPTTLVHARAGCPSATPPVTARAGCPSATPPVTLRPTPYYLAILLLHADFLILRYLDETGSTIVRYMPWYEYRTHAINSGKHKQPGAGGFRDSASFAARTERAHVAPIGCSACGQAYANESHLPCPPSPRNPTGNLDLSCLGVSRYLVASLPRHL